MSIDVVEVKLKELVQNMSDVIDAYGYYAKYPGHAQIVTIRWDAPVFSPSRNPIEVLHGRLQVLLKHFEHMTIERRLLRRNMLDRLVEIARKEGADVQLMILDNVDPGLELKDRFAECALRCGDFVFEYTNNDFLPSMTLRPLSVSSMTFA